MATLQDFKDLLSTTADKSAAAETAPVDTTLYNRTNSMGKRANDTAKWDATTSQFTGKRSKGAGNLIDGQLEDYKELVENLEDYKRDVSGARSSGRGGRELERATEKSKKKLTDSGRKVLKDIERGLEQHHEVIGIAAAEKSKLLGELGSDFATKLSKATTEVEKDFLRTNYAAVKERIDKHFYELVTGHEESISEFKRIAQEVEEHTNLKLGATVEKAAVAGEKTLAHEVQAVEKASALTHVAGGAAVGAAVGYMVAGEDSKTQGAVVGGVAGGIVGKVVQHMKNAKTSLSHTVAGAEARTLLSQMGHAAGRFHG